MVNGRIDTSGCQSKGTRIDVFRDIFWVFLGLGTLVSVVVISYMLYNAYKYRDGSERPADEEFTPPKLGELSQRGGGGKKLFVSFGLSTIIVVSLIVWTYGTLLYVEGAPAQESDALEITHDPVCGTEGKEEYSLEVNGETVNFCSEGCIETFRQEQISSRNWRDELRSWGGWYKLGTQYRKEWSMIYKDIIAGFLIARFVIVFVPQWVWNTLFIPARAR